MIFQPMTQIKSGQGNQRTNSTSNDINYETAKGTYWQASMR